MWKNLCYNPYENIVQENENGQRRVQISGGWIEEDKISTALVCRANSSEDLEIASSSMSNPVIARSYNYNAFQCFAVWTVKKNTQTKISELDSFKENKIANIFKMKVENGIGKRAILTWFMGYGWHKRIVKWEYAMRYISPTAIRGAQVGLYNFLKQYENKKWIEFGLMNSTDSAVWKIEPHLRKVWSKTLDSSPVAPLSYQTSRWLTPPVIVNKSAFKSSIVASSKSQSEVIDSTWNSSHDVARIMWCTKRTLSAYGKEVLPEWWRWFAHGTNEGIVVFDEAKSQEQQDLINELIKTKKVYQRWGIFDEDKCVQVVVLIGLHDDIVTGKKIDFNQWIGECPEIREDESLNEEDDFGRVPYRALSKTGTAVGVAPKRLEQSIHESLVDLKAKKGNIDTWIAKLLKIKKADLGSSLSAEQIDAIALSISAFERNEGLILADETGFGKGRILASLALIGLKLGKTVLFFTEKAQLFTDFYRDLTDVGGIDLKLSPTLLHGKAKIFDPNGNLITKSLSPKNQEIMLNTPDWNKKEDKLIMSTYSQINRENKKGSNKKVRWLIDRIKTGECWLLLDEAHNGAGDSNIADNLNSLLKYTNGVLYSSATYAKTEANLTLYKKAMAVDKWAEKLIISSLENDTGSLREALTTSMAKKGRFIRREHPPVPPPQPIWIDMTPEREEAFQAFCTMWQMIFRATEGWEKAAGNFGAIAWAKLGSLLSRSIREFSFLVKLDALIDRIKYDINNNEKVVITLESTFESALRKVLGQLDDEDEIEPEEVDKDEEPTSKKNNEIIVDHIPLWKERWDIILGELAPIEELREMGADNESIAQVEALIEDAKQSIKKLPEWDLMPIEKMKRELAASGIEMGELSGRTLTYEIIDGKQVIKPRKGEIRTELVRRFNSGEFDVMLVSLAGASGISLHAGAKFKDQRKRNLYEGDIAVNPSMRVQFWGRVRRKDQVCEPFFGSLALNTPGERRIQAKENKKREKLAAHVGMKQSSRELSWISPEGESIVAEWVIDKPRYAKLIGVKNSMQGEPTGRVDRALVRSIILPQGEQDALLARLDRGLKLAADVAYHESNGVFAKQSRVVRRNWLWGHPDATQEISKSGGELSVPRVDYVERVFEKNVKPNEENVIKKYKEVKVMENSHEYEGSYVLNKWLSVWDEEKNRGVFYDRDYRGFVSTWLNKNLPNCAIGKAIRVTRPGTGQAAWGIILGMEYPNEGARFNGATAWSLTQVAVNVWLVGEEEPMLITMARCYRDPYFSVPGTNANVSWFSADTVSFTGIAIEGNPLIAALWARGWNVGNPMLVKDEDKGFEWVWMLPGSWTWDTLKNLPKDLIDVEHAVDFLCKYQNAELYAALPNNALFKMKLMKGIISFEIDSGLYKAGTESWITFKSKQVMRQVREITRNGKQFTTFNVEQKSIYYFLNVLEGFGIKWRVGAEYNEWYTESSKRIIEKLLLGGKNMNTASSSKKTYARKK